MTQFTPTLNFDSSTNRKNSFFLHLVIALISILLFFTLLSFTYLSVLEAIAITLTFYNFSIYIDTLGKYINIPEQIVAVFSFQLLFMPVVAYNFQPQDMYINSEQYFSYTIPVLLALLIGFKLPNKHNKDHTDALVRIKSHLKDSNQVSYILCGVGLLSSIIQLSVPTSLRQIMTLFSNCLYTAVLYNYFSSNKKRYIVLWITIFSMALQSIREGMFGHFFAWGIVWLPYFVVGKKFFQNFLPKFLLILVIFTFLPVIQGVKFQYRRVTWAGVNVERQGNSDLLLNLFVDRIDNYKELADKDIIYSSFNRLNQGNLLSKAMSYVPYQEPYAEGEIFLHFAYPFIPRLIWNEKPVTGGFQNMKRFTGVENDSINSSNISPIGEAYVNFGVNGGIIFMFFYGLLFGHIYNKLFEKSKTNPSLFLWIPSLFVAGVVPETDVLTIWGTCATGMIFLMSLYFVTKRINFSM